MRWVQHAALRPHRCAAVPFVGNSNCTEGFIDTGVDLPGFDPHVYVSVQAVKEMARMIGWAPRLSAETVNAEMAAKDARIAELERHVAENERVVAAANTLVEAQKLAA